jgi:DNA topoisomerase-1
MLSAQILCQLGATKNKEEIKSNLAKTTKRVSKHLGNTPKICRSYYIHPTVFKTYEDDILIPYITQHRQKSKTENLKPTEFAVLQLLRNFPV